jgi:pilus assembly protein Flp/PilA
VAGRKYFKLWPSRKGQKNTWPVERLGKLKTSGASMTKLRNFLRDENGATAIEYGLIAACISVAIILAITTVGTNLNNTFTNVSNALK